MKTVTGKILGLALSAAFIFGINFSASAQSARNFRPATNAPYALLQNPVLTNSPFAVSTIRQVLATTPAPLSVPVISTTNHSESGTYWTMLSPVPLPGNFFPDLPVYLLDATNRTFLIDDRSVDYAVLNARIAAENATNGFGLTFQANDLIIDTNRLWLSVATNALPGSNQFNIVIHTTVTGNYYDVLTKSDLILPTWGVEKTVVGAAGNTTPVTLQQNNRTNLFVWARDSIIPIYTQPLAQEVFSGDTVTFTVGAGGSGLFYQWTFNGTNIYGATGSSYTIQGVNTNNAGEYACIIHNADGTVTTQAATLTVDQGSGWPYDMSTIGQRQDYTFRSGVTYLITSPIELLGKTTIEGGAIIKFDYNYPYPCLLVLGSLDCQGGAYNPAVLTSVDDDTFGVGEQDSTGAPQPIFTGVPFLDLTYAGSVSLSNLRFRYADMAVGAPYHARLDVWDSQFVQCYAGVVNDFGGTDGFHNVLFAGCFDAVAGYTNAYAVEMEQVTADVTNVWDSTVSPSRLALTNSLIFGSIGSVSAYSAQGVTVAPDASEFQTSGTGNYYLAAASSLRRSGITNISARLRTELQQKTTSPPLVFPQLMNLSGNLTLLPQVPRYTNGAPDRGYYYDALDYTVAWMTVSGSLTIEPGTAIGVRNEPIPGAPRYTWYGLDLRENSSVVSHGLPNKPNIFADTQTVQEQDEYASSSLFVPDFQGSPSAAAPTMDFRFSKLYAPAGGFQVWGGEWEFVYYGSRLASYDSLVNWTMRDCELHGGRISLGLPNIQIDLTLYYGAGAVDWENNLFENVNINLNPATWWYNGVVNFDESLTARNNLFKGANWMAIEPVPASAGNWTFTDNLFDGIDFQVDSAAPLDFDHNGYRPLPASQTFSNSSPIVVSLTANDSTALASDTNNLGGFHEVFLDYALPYASGAFGNYYLSTITPLWQAGSRLAADAGLTQYTTFASQFKDAANHPVNIGLHYVVATNSLPLDTDHDGVPDYVETEHGTDPSLASTDGTTPDALNAAYDDVDLSGNGLVGRIKKALGLNPTNSVNPLTLKQVITGEEPDFATFEVPVSYDAVTGSGALNVNMNGIDVSLEECTRATNGNCLLSFNVAFDPAGLHYLSAGFRLANEPDAELHPVMTASGIIQSFVSSNSAQFFENGSMFDDTSAYLDAKVFAPNADYVIRLYNPDTTPRTLLASITNSTTDGVIQEEWNLVADNGSTYAGGSVEAEYDVTPDNSSGYYTAAFAGKSRKILTRATNSLSEWGPNMDVAYFYTPTNSSLTSEFAKDGAVWNGMQGVVDALTMPAFGYDVYNSYFNHYTCYFCGPNERPYPGYITSRLAATNNLLTDLANGLTKQFYAYGHGNSNYIGNYTSDAYLSSYDVRDKLHNTYAKVGGLKAQNPYRFVFLDGCSTASAKDWRRAFGIYPLDVTNSLIRSKVGPQAYVGWADVHVGWFNQREDSVYAVNIETAYAQTLANFYTDWMNGTPLVDCIYNGTKSSYGTVPLPVPENTQMLVTGNGYRYNFTNVMTGKIYLIGFPGLEVKTTDHRFDTDKTYAAPKIVE